MDLKKQIDPLIKLINNDVENDYELTLELERILRNYLTHNKHDSEIWIMLALVIYQSPINDDVGAVECLEYVFSYDHNNYKAALLLSYINNYSYFTWKENFIEFLDKIICPTSEEVLALLEYVKHLYYEFHLDKIKAEYHLLKSIEYDDTLVWNNIHLARFYLWEQNNIVLYKKYLHDGFHNIKYVYRDDIADPYYDAFNIDEFINERLKGIHLSSMNYAILEEDYKRSLKM